MSSGIPSRLGHAGVLDEHRKDGDPPLERGLDLEPHEVLGIGESRSIVAVRDREPPIANHGDQDAAGAHFSLDVLDEVDAGGDRVDIQEDLRAEFVLEVVGEAPGLIATVVTAVRNEDPRSSRSPCDGRDTTAFPPCPFIQRASLS